MTLEFCNRRFDKHFVNVSYYLARFIVVHWNINVHEMISRLTDAQRRGLRSQERKEENKMVIFSTLLSRMSKHYQK